MSFRAAGEENDFRVEGPATLPGGRSLVAALLGMTADFRFASLACVEILSGLFQLGVGGDLAAFGTYALTGSEAFVLMKPMQTARRGSCWRQWSTPVRLDPNVDDAIARFPRIAVGAGKIYVIGVEFQLADDRPMPDNPLHVWGTDGSSIGRPAGHFRYLFPRGAVDAKGRLHLIWGEPASDAGAVSVRQWYFLPSQTLWTATFDPTSGWSAPAKLGFTLSGIDGLKWDWRGTADTFGSGHAQGIGLEERRRRRGAPLEYLNLDDSGDWLRSYIAVPRDAGAIAVVAEGQRILAFYASTEPDAGLSATESAPVSAIMLHVSRDRGATWESPRLVALAASGGVRDLHAVAVRDGQLHLVWGEDTPRGAAIRHAFSRDSAATWLVSADLVLPGKIRNVRSVVDSCGVVHVVGEDWQDGPDHMHIDYARFDGAWSEVEHLFRDRTAMTPDLRLTISGQPVMVFVARMSAKPDSRFATYYSAMQR